MSNSDQANAAAQYVGTVVTEMRRAAGYLARQEIERLQAACRADPFRLEPYGYKVYSQNDEDGILAEIFRRVGVGTGTFCEIGVEDGLECNTLYLLHQGWRGIWLEGNEAQRAPIVSKFGSLLESRRLGLGVGYVTRDNINATIGQGLAAMGVDAANLDFLSIDIDGMDIYLLEALQFQPKVICIEYNAKFPPPVSKKPVFNETLQWRGTDYMGSSLSAIAETAGRKGYTLVGTNLTGANAFLVRNDLVQDRFCKSPTPEALYNPPRYYLWVDHYQGSVGHRADFGPYTDLV